jgi:oligopeptide transport system substrate-binding protein
LTMTHNPFSIVRWWIAPAALLLTASLCVGDSSTPPTADQSEPDSAPSINGPANTLGDYGIDRDNALVLAGSEPDTLDPAKWLYGAEGVVEDLYSGLVRLGANLQPVPDLAEDWAISPDGTVYTFHLRRDVTFHDGKRFTAEDVRYSWDRAVSPDLGSHTAATYLNDIVGVSDVLAGRADTISGVRVLDEYTVEVTLDAPKAYFLYKLSAPAAWIVDRDTISEIETSPNGTGPFILLRHVENEVFILQRNPNYHLGPPALEHVVYLIYAVPIRLYESGDIDMVYITEDLVARAQDPSDPLYGNVQIVNSLCTDFIVFDVTQPPFDDPLVRRAFVLAVDKDAYGEVILGGTGVLADGVFPPGMPGYTPDIAPLPYDPEAAAQALRDSSYGSPEGLPPVSFTTVGYGGEISSRDGLLIQMWQRGLGVTVTPKDWTSTASTMSFTAAITVKSSVPVGAPTIPTRRISPSYFTAPVSRTRAITAAPM